MESKIDVSEIAEEDILYGYEENGEDKSYSPEVKVAYWKNQCERAIKNFSANIPDVGTLMEDFRSIMSADPMTKIIRFNELVDLCPNEEFKQRMGDLTAEVEKICWDKGFRYSGALLTPNEHDRCGSTRGKYGDIAPNIPFPIIESMILEGKINGDLLAEELEYIEGKSEDRKGLSLEEVDRARRLSGNTRLNLETGEATKEIDEEASKDSYYFLNEDEKASVVARESKVLTGVSQIMAEVSGSLKGKLSILSQKIQAYSKGEVSTANLLQAHDDFCSGLGDRQEFNLKRFIKHLRALNFELGYRDPILTPQEILLRSGAEVGENFTGQPYTPLAIQDRSLSVEEVRRLRDGECGVMIITTQVQGMGDYPDSTFRLETLDDTGKTVTSPNLVDRDDPGAEMSEQYREMIAPEFAKNFPFPRDDDWFMVKEKS